MSFAKRQWAKEKKVWELGDEKLWGDKQEFVVFLFFFFFISFPLRASHSFYQAT